MRTNRPQLLPEDNPQTNLTLSGMTPKTPAAMVDKCNRDLSTVGLRFGVKIDASLNPLGKVALRPVASVLFCFATMVASALAQDEAKVMFAISIAPSQNATEPGTPVWNAGAPVFVIVTMTNNSNRTLHLSLSNPAFDYRMTVQDDATGQPVSETEQYRKMKESQKSHFHTTRFIVVTLKPHESCHDTIEVSYLYDLSLPGEYSIQVERDKPTELGKGRRSVQCDQCHDNAIASSACASGVVR